MAGTTRHRITDERLCRLCTVVLVLCLLLFAEALPSSALTGQATCPVTTDTATMTAWCVARFGGYGGVLTAGSWDRNRDSFACVCNGNTNAALSITRLTTSLQRADVRSQLGSVARATSPITLADSMSASATESTASGVVYSDEDSSSSSLSSSSGMSSHASSSSKHASSSSSQDVVVHGSCSWSGVFTGYPDGVQCMATTGVCPITCSMMPSNLCDNQYTDSVSCTSGAAYVVSYTCLTCNGRNYTISSTAADSCTRYYSSADTCDAQSACSGHGCCVGSSSGTTCSCFSDGTNGYYTGSTCSSCQTGYSENSNHLCLVATNRVQFILASIAKTWTMVAPNMAVLFLFVIFGVTRKLNTSDRPFDLTGLRRANLSTVQVARRRQQSLFHSKYIPMRPAKSRSFANPHQPHTRGPPAF